MRRSESFGVELVEVHDAARRATVPSSRKLVRRMPVELVVACDACDACAAEPAVALAVSGKAVRASFEVTRVRSGPANAAVILRRLVRVAAQLRD